MFKHNLEQKLLCGKMSVIKESGVQPWLKYVTKYILVKSKKDLP